MYDVLIIGAGVVGSFIARTLSRYNLNICIVEKDNDIAMGTTKANSAIIHAGYDCKPNSLKAKLNVEGNSMMDKVSNELDIPFERIGSLVLAFDKEDNKTLESLIKRAEQNGVDGCEIWDKKMVLKKEPNLSDSVTGALYSKTAGIICPYELNIGVVENAVTNGVDLKLNCEVLSILKNKHFTVKTNQGEIKSAFVINAAGVYSDKIANMVGDKSFSIKPRKGEYLLFDKKFSGIVNRVIFQCPSKMGKGILVTPTVDGNMIMGPTALDIEDRADRSTSDDGIAKVKKGGQKSLKSVDFSGVIHSFSGIRATGSTGDFVISQSEVCDNFINVGAIESPGLSSAPAISEYVKDILVNAGLKLKSNKNYNPIRKKVIRFRELSNKEREKIVKKNPKYGHIICRCEMVTEGEIVDAINRPAGATDLDGVKRRTRSGMGRCQGGFCKPKVVEILSRELNIPMTDVTKKGADSFVLTSKIKEN